MSHSHNYYEEFKNIKKYHYGQRYFSIVDKRERGKGGAQRKEKGRGRRQGLGDIGVRSEVGGRWWDGGRRRSINC